jgi:hypothetical protein
VRPGVDHPRLGSGIPEKRVESGIGVGDIPFGDGARRLVFIRRFPHIEGESLREAG